MAELEARKVVQAEELAGVEAPAPRLFPGLAEVYRTRVAELTAALAADDGAELRERVRGLVETIRLIPEEGRLRVEVRGELGAILRLAEGAKTQKKPRQCCRGVRGANQGRCGATQPTFPIH